MTDLIALRLQPLMQDKRADTPEEAQSIQPMRPLRLDELQSVSGGPIIQNQDG